MKNNWLGSCGIVYGETECTIDDGEVSAVFTQYPELREIAFGMAWDAVIAGDVQTRRVIFPYDHVVRMDDECVKVYSLEAR